MILLDGNKTALAIKNEIAQEVLDLKKKGKRPPHLAAVIVGNNGASLTYVNAKVKACKYVGLGILLRNHPLISQQLSYHS